MEGKRFAQMFIYIYISHARAEIYYRRWVVVAVVAVVVAKKVEP